ncbi:signal recognition particle 43 kDa protein [Pyrus ussuriensis x Pyrus communis]|uniref:Signal recognition particle 43 kDa protein n=1 Tax=Pyrus ussuriensis x Pyrus communis TaxID=2448454 RepID=A0A5N5FIB1_9ROSA|nr:signal recognition particle 43 kDa protein [Pyrus ussuriensis x Pyrus communis]
MISKYESLWWTAAKKDDKYALNQLIASENDSCDDVDRDNHTTLIFISSLGLKLCVRVLAEAMGANLEVEDEIRRKLLDLAKEILKTMPQGNLIHFARRLRLKSVITKLEGVIFEAGLEYAVAKGVVGKRVRDEGKMMTHPDPECPLGPRIEPCWSTPER